MSHKSERNAATVASYHSEMCEPVSVNLAPTDVGVEEKPASPSDGSDFYDRPCRLFARCGEKSPSLGAVESALLSIICGVIFGIFLGLMGPYPEFHNYATDCPRFVSREGCEAWKHSGCTWLTLPEYPQGKCMFLDFADGIDCRNAGSDQQTCKEHGNGRCEMRAGECEHVRGYTFTEIGLLAGVPMAGCLFGPFPAAALLSRLNFRKCHFVFGLIGMLACALFTTGRLINSLPLVLIARFVAGINVNGIRYLVPLYSFSMCQSRSTAGLVLTFLHSGSQTTLGIMFLFSWALQPRNMSGDPGIEGRIHAQIALSWLAAVGYLVLVFFIREPLVNPSSQPTSASSVKSDATADSDTEASESIWRHAWRHIDKLLCGCAVTGAFLGTGLNPLAVFGPVYAQDVYGLEPLIVPVIIAAASFPGDVGSLVLRLIKPDMPARTLMLVGTSIIIVADLLIGLPALPALGASDGVRFVLARVGLCIFYLTMELCVGTTFFDLGVSIMPPRLKGPGSALLSTMLSVISVAMSTPVPNVIAAISGDDQGQQKGFGAVMLIQASIGLMCLIVMYFKMHPWVEPLGTGRESTAPGCKVEIKKEE